MVTWVKMKECTKCKIKKELQFFPKEKKGYRSQCKECRKAQQKIRQIKNEELRLNNNIVLTEKKCSKCKNTLSIINFTKSKESKDGFNSFCKNCRREKDKRLKELKKNTLNIDLFHKICEKCKINKLSTEFRTNRASNDKIFSICNECWPKPTWNKEKQRLSCIKYTLKNKDKIRLKWKRDGKKINRRVRDSLNHRISGALKSVNNYKNNKTIKYLGCTIPFFKKWIEYQFKDNMNWENYGLWELDHVKPCSSFLLEKEEEQLKCFNWTNLQPLWKIDNIKKGGIVDINLIKIHLEKAYRFSAQVKEGELREPPKVLDTNLS